MNRYKPIGWRKESHRHYLAAKGVKTKYDFSRRYMARNALEFEKDSLKKVMLSGRVKTIDDAYEYFDEHTPKVNGETLGHEEVRKLFDQIRAEYITAVHGTMAKEMGEDLEVSDEGNLSHGASMSTEVASMRVAQNLRDTGKAQSGAGELTAAGVRKMIRESGVKINPYAATYINSIDDAEAMYGADGVRGQIPYILSNMRFSRTDPKQVELKKKLTELSKSKHQYGAKVTDFHEINEHVPKGKSFDIDGVWVPNDKGNALDSARNHLHRLQSRKDSEDATVIARLKKSISEMK